MLNSHRWCLDEYFWYLCVLSLEEKWVFWNTHLAAATENRNTQLEEETLFLLGYCYLVVSYGVWLLRLCKFLANTIRLRKSVLTPTTPVHFITKPRIALKWFRLESLKTTHFFCIVITGVLTYRVSQASWQTHCRNALYLWIINS